MRLMSLRQKFLIQIGFCSCLLLLMFASCSDSDGCTQGMGGSVTIDLDLDQVRSVKVEGAFLVTVEQADEQLIRAVGQENIINDLDLDVNNGVWTVRLDDSKCYSNLSLEIRIFVPIIEGVIANGSESVVLNSFDSLDNFLLEVGGSGVVFQSGILNIGDTYTIRHKGSSDVVTYFETSDLDFEMTGSGNLAMRGSANQSQMVIAGSGSLSGFELISQICGIKTSGSGDAQLTVIDSLDVAISGSGNVSYKGRPVILLEDTGSGELIDAN